jgi:hypothetical protein
MLSGKCDPLFAALQATKWPRIASDELSRATAYNNRVEQFSAGEFSEPLLNHFQRSGNQAGRFLASRSNFK